MLNKVKKLPHRRTAVTVLSGLLGAGKTTLLNHVLHNKAGLKVAVIVNEMREVNGDAQLVKDQNTLSHTEEKLVEMSNGCICCTLREDLMLEVEKLALENRFNYLLIKSSDISEPLPVAQTFSYVDEEKGIDLSRFSRLDTLVSVVDAFNFSQDFGSVDTIYQRELNNDVSDTRTIVNLLSRHQVGELKSILHKLKPKVRIIESEFSKVDPAQILNTRLFDFDEAYQSAGWIQELQNYKNGVAHAPARGPGETEEYGISSFVFRDRKPFHPVRFWHYLSENFSASIIHSNWTAEPGLFCWLPGPTMR